MSLVIYLMSPAISHAWDTLRPPPPTPAEWVNEWRHDNAGCNILLGAYKVAYALSVAADEEFDAIDSTMHDAIDHIWQIIEGDLDPLTNSDTAKIVKQINHYRTKLSQHQSTSIRSQVTFERAMSLGNELWENCGPRG